MAHEYLSEKLTLRKVQDTLKNNETKEWNSRTVSDSLNSENLKKVGAICSIVFASALIVTGLVLLGLVSGGVIPAALLGVAIVPLALGVMPGLPMAFIMARDVLSK